MPDHHIPSRSWLAVRHIMCHVSLTNRVEMYLDDENEVISPDITNESWSGGQRALIDAAVGLHAPIDAIPLANALSRLSPHNCKRVADAIDFAFCQEIYQ